MSFSSPTVTWMVKLCLIGKMNMWQGMADESLIVSLLQTEEIWQHSAQHTWLENGPFSFFTIIYFRPCVSHGPSACLLALLSCIEPVCLTWSFLSPILPLLLLLTYFVFLSPKKTVRKYYNTIKEISIWQMLQSASIHISVVVR